MSRKRYSQRILHLLCVGVVFLVLYGCSNQTATSSIVSYPADISVVDDFKCVCSINQQTEFVVEEDASKELYTYIQKQWAKASETKMDTSKQDCIYLLFQVGEPFLISSQENETEKSNAHAVSQANYYGVLWIHENDYMVFTAMPFTSFQRYYQMPEGTYDRVMKMVMQ